MEENKSIKVRVDPGNEDVPGFVKFLDQRGNLKCGKPVMKLTLFVNLFQWQKKPSVTRSKRKATETEKMRRKQVKYRKTNDNSQRAKSDYARDDGGQGVKDIVKDVPLDYLERMILDYYTTNVKISEHRSLDIEWVTRGQGTPDNIGSNIWLAERRKRNTSSNTGAIARRRSTTEVANVIKLVLYCTFRRNIATDWGKLQEPATCEAYIEAKHSTSPGRSVKSTGLVIHPSPHRNSLQLISVHSLWCKVCHIFGFASSTS